MLWSGGWLVGGIGVAGNQTKLVYTVTFIEVVMYSLR